MKLFVLKVVLCFGLIAGAKVVVANEAVSPALMRALQKPLTYVGERPATTQELKQLTDQSRVPGFQRIYIDALPNDFAQEGNPFLFKKTLTPLILRENERIEAERLVLKQLNDKYLRGEAFSQEEEAFLAFLLEKYDSSMLKTKETQLADLLLKVDKIPPSLVIAQAALTTNWGKQNRLTPFDQYAWLDRNTYAPMPYDSLGEAVAAFMLELNSSMPMFLFRNARMQNRTLGPPAGQVYVPFMHEYRPDDPSYEERLKQAFKGDPMFYYDISFLVGEADIFNSETLGFGKESFIERFQRYWHRLKEVISQLIG